MKDSKVHQVQIIVLWQSASSEFVHTNVGWMTKNELGLK